MLTRYVTAGICGLLWGLVIYGFTSSFVTGLITAGVAGFICAITLELVGRRR